jgi:hypothetical protein
MVGSPLTVTLNPPHWHFPTLSCRILLCQYYPPPTDLLPLLFCSLFITRGPMAIFGIVLLIDKHIDTDLNEALALSTGSNALFDLELPKKTATLRSPPFLSIGSPVPSVGAKSIV